jgi:sensor c-di-GMP phosphodiesterase-like protein
VEWWIAGGVLILALILLLVVLLVLAGHVRRFGGVATMLNTRLTDGQQRFQPRVDAIQKQAEALQEKLLRVQEQVEVVQARRGQDGNS